jgi:ribonuclease Y
MDPIIVIVLVAAGLTAGFVVGQLRRRTVFLRTVADAEDEAHRIREEAEAAATTKLQEIELEGRDRIAAKERRFQDEVKRQRKEQESLRRDLEKKQRNLNRRHELVESKDAEVQALKAEYEERSREVEEARNEAVALRDQQQARLEQVARMTQEQARQDLTYQIRSEVRRDAASYLRKIQEETRQEAEREVERLVIQSLERFSSGQMIDATTTVVELPNEEMKGRIIGREGRNIRSLEAATGIDVLVDDTPQAILLSCFDPVRREVARLSVQKLIEDGRIHPARIEEVVEKTAEAFDEHLLEEGEALAFELGLTEVHPRLIKAMGRMRYCHSGGHNLLQHTRETVLLATNMASQLSADIEVVRRAAFLHEVGTVDDSSPEVHPALRSADLAAKFNESEAVVRALRSLDPAEHDRSLEGILVQMGHAISDARPGARKNNLDIFTHRLSEMEEIARSFKGVLNAFAVKAGKELRVLVNSETVSDADSIWLARDIARRIQSEVNYPGQIRVSVVREVRAVDFAM